MAEFKWESTTSKLYAGHCIHSRQCAKTISNKFLRHSAQSVKYLRNLSMNPATS